MVGPGVSLMLAAPDGPAKSLVDGLVVVADEVEQAPDLRPDTTRGRMFAVVGAITTFASAVSFGFAGFLVEAAGWRPVYLGGGLIDVVCAAVLAVILRRRASHPARLPLPAEAQSPEETQPGQGD